MLARYLAKVLAEELVEELRKNGRDLKKIGLSSESARRVSVFWKYLKVQISDWVYSYYVEKLTFGATILKRLLP